MSALSKLKLVTATRPTALSPLLHRRNKLLAKLDEQAKIAEALASGDRYTSTRYKKVTDSEGNSKTVTVEKRVKDWTYTGEDGKLYLTVRYGNKLLELAKGKQAIEAGDSNGLLKAIDLLKQAVSNGELDTHITSAASATKKSFNK